MSTTIVVDTYLHLLCRLASIHKNTPPHIWGDICMIMRNHVCGDKWQNVSATKRRRRIPEPSAALFELLCPAPGSFFFVFLKHFLKVKTLTCKSKRRDPTPCYTEPDIGLAHLGLCTFGFIRINLLPRASSSESQTTKSLWERLNHWMFKSDAGYFKQHSFSPQISDWLLISFFCAMCKELWKF